MRGFTKLAILANILILGNISAVNAQALLPQSMPPTRIDPGVINSSLLNNSPDNGIKGVIEKSQEENLKTPELETPEQSVCSNIGTVKLSKVIFSGNTVFNSKDLEKYTAKILEKDLSIDDINNVTAEITEAYRVKGYITCFAYIPPQTIKDGVLEIGIFEGKIGNISIQGAKWTRNYYLKSNIFKANNFEKNKVFNVNNLQRSLHQINNTEYLKGQVTIQKGEEPATTDIILDIEDKLPIKLGASWDNMGRDLIGTQRANIFLADNNLTGFGDSVYGGVSLATRSFGVNSVYSIPLGHYGTEFKFGYGFSGINIGGSFEQLKIHGSSHIFSSSLVQPLYKGDGFEVNSNASFDFINSKTTLLNSINLQSYNIRALRIGLNGIKEDNSGRWIADAQISTGLPLFGATIENSRDIGSGKFIKFGSNLIRVQALPSNVTGIFRISGQFSPNTLLAPEQLQLGGMYNVRGYDEGLLLGDVGYNASIELRKLIPFMPEFNISYGKRKKLNVNLKDKVQFAVFYDHGFTKAIHQNTPTTYANFLQSVGFGIRCHLTKFITANIDMGIPLGRKRSENQNAVKIHFGLSSSLF